MVANILLTGHDLVMGRELVSKFLRAYSYDVDELFIQPCTEFMDFDNILRSNNLLVISRLSKHDYNQIDLIHELIKYGKDFCIAANPIASKQMIEQYIQLLTNRAAQGKLTMLYPNIEYRNICEEVSFNLKYREGIIYNKVLEHTKNEERAKRFACYEGYVTSIDGFVL